MNNADIIITHAHLTTMIGERPGADALAIADGRITAIGETSALLAQREKNTKVIDAGLNTVMPGIVESHLHLFSGAVELDGLSVNHIKGLQALSDSVCEYAKARGNEPVIVAHGGNHVMLRDHGGITRHDLDQVLADRPFIMVCFDHHTMWANTRALEMAGLLHGRRLPPGNEIVIGADGLATGELKEPAAFSSDWPISPRSPFLGMQSAMIQKPLRPDCPPQAQSLTDAIHAFTLGGAYAEFMEDRKGMLKEDCLADVVLLDRDIEATPPEQLGEITPLLTICGGRVTFEQ